MQQLKLPPCDLKIKSEEGNDFVFDIIRKKYIVLTPEEWVRQHFVHLMINHLGYPKSLIKVESGLSYFKSTKRSDITLMSRNTTPFLLIECKAPEIKIDRKTLNQISVYNKTIEAKFVAITNGFSNFIWKYEGGQYEQLTEFPLYK